MGRRCTGDPETHRKAALKLTASVYLAAALAFASAAVSLYWTLGGTSLLATVGGTIEKLARERSATAVAVGIGATLVKTAAGLLALALLNPVRSGPARRLLIAANTVASGILIVWGGANVLVGGVTLTHVVEPAGTVDRRSLAWHVFVWDMWFLVWGLALALATHRYRRQSSQPLVR